MLDLEKCLGQDLLKQIFKKVFPHPAPELGGPQELLKRRDVFTDIVDPARGLLKLAQFSMDVRHDEARVLEVLMNGMPGIRQGVG